jgi:hypothetical protein
METEGTLINSFLQRLSSTRSILEHKVLSYQTSDGITALSDIYKFDTLLSSVAYAHQIGYAGERFHLGTEVKYGLVNIAAFLAQSQNEGIRANNACDGSYSFSNVCGLRNYQHYTCSDTEKAMECPDNIMNCGQGALLTKGVCMMGKINHYLGKRAANEGRNAMFPDIDFCSNNAEDICQYVDRYPNIVWDVAFFEWVVRIQSYRDENFNYIESLHQFVEGGMRDTTFINTVSKIVSSGSSNADDVP